MKLTLFLFLLFGFVPDSQAQNSIYTIPLDTLGGGKSIDLSSYRGKKLLFINSASSDSAKIQYIQIKQLSRQFRDNLVIIVLPSNSFESDTLSDASLFAFYSQEVTNHFPVGGKVLVRGSGMHPIYQWLTQKSNNGLLDSEVVSPFQKYLVNKKGKLVGVFSGRVNLFDGILINAIAIDNNQ